MPVSSHAHGRSAQSQYWGQQHILPLPKWLNHFIPAKKNTSCSIGQHTRQDPLGPSSTVCKAFLTYLLLQQVSDFQQHPVRLSHLSQHLGPNIASYRKHKCQDLQMMLLVMPYSTIAWLVYSGFLPLCPF